MKTRTALATMLATAVSLAVASPIIASSPAQAVRPVVVTKTVINDPANDVMLMTMMPAVAADASQGKPRATKVDVGTSVDISKVTVRVDRSARTLTMRYEIADTRAKGAFKQGVSTNVHYANGKTISLNSAVGSRKVTVTQHGAKPKACQRGIARVNHKKNTITQVIPFNCLNHAKAARVSGSISGHDNSGFAAYDEVSMTGQIRFSYPRLAVIQPIKQH